MSDTKNKKTILVTGGAGFIGSHLVKKYLDEGHRVIAVDNLQTTWKPKNIERYFSNKNFLFLNRDIIQPLSIKEPIDWIINCACAGSPTSYQFNPVHTIKTNTIGVMNLLELARIKNARFLQTSTSEVYGDPLVTPQPEEYRGNVNTLGPRACYDEGKRVAETLCMDYHREYGVDVRIVRIFNTYGPNMDPNDGRAITNFMMNAVHNKDLVIYGDGTNSRSFQYIDDLLQGIDLMMKKDGVTGPVNLGNPHEMTVKEMAELVIKKVDSTSNIVFHAEATDDPKQRCPDITYANELLGWKPETTLEEGLDATIAYFRTVELPEKKVLVFATTYYPDMGPAEEALYKLSQEMPDTEFHIITTKFKKGMAEVEEVGTDKVHRIGVGSSLDKYLLPILGIIKARKLHKQNNYRFVWSVMGSYSGITALLFRLMHQESNLLLTLDDKELSRTGIKMRFLSPIYRFVLGKAETIYVSNVALAHGSDLVSAIPRMAQSGDTKSFMNSVRYRYSDIANKQESKLGRFK